MEALYRQNGSPLVETGITHAMFKAQFRNGRSCLGLLQISVQNWLQALNHFMIEYPERLAEYL